MVKRTGTTNPVLKDLISLLKKKSFENKVKIWKRIANDLEKPTRIRRKVNLTRIDKHTKDNETIVVPGKVLGMGSLNHKVSIAAFSFSEQALEKISKSGSSSMSIKELVEKNPKASKVRIIG